MRDVMKERRAQTLHCPIRKVMTRELHELRGEAKRLREVERLAKAYGAAAAARDERLAALDKETTPNG